MLNYRYSKHLDLIVRLVPKFTNIPTNRTTQKNHQQQFLLNGMLELEQVARAYHFQKRIRSTHPLDDAKLLLDAYRTCCFKDYEQGM